MESNWPSTWPNVLPADLHVFDPNGDILIQLGDTVAVEEPANGGSRPLVSPALELVSDIGPEEASYPPESIPQEPQASISNEDIRTSDPGGLPLEAEPEIELHSTRPVYLRVSSRHLILASAMFETMLGSDNFPEGRKLRSEGTLVIRVPDDLQSLTMLMYIIHGMTRKVPRNLNLQLLTTIANLVNYYQLHEVVELFSDRWIANLKQQKTFPKSSSPEVFSWLFISWVFKLEDEFKKMTCILVRESDNEFLDNIDESIPIPPSIISRIQEMRIEAIEHMITIMHDQITKYLTSDVPCSDNNGNGSFCVEFVLGSLIKGSAAIGIWPKPKAPYGNITFKSLASRIREMKLLDSCNKSHGSGYHSSGWGLDSSVKGVIKASISSLEDKFCGLSLDLFLPGKPRGDKLALTLLEAQTVTEPSTSQAS